MKKNCETCKHEDNQYYAYPFKVPCDKCVTVKGSDIPSEWEAAEHYTPDTNADRIRAMSDEELMQLLFTKISCGHICSFCVPTMRTERKCDGHCRNGVLKWLQQPAEGE